MEALKIEQGFAKMDDGMIVKRIIAGEKMLFEILLRRYNQMLYRIIRSYVKDENEVQDAMQNTYLKAFDKLQQFQGNSSFSTWLIRIGINEALQRLNSIKKEKVIFLNEVDSENEFEKFFVNQSNPEKMIIRQEAGRILERAIDNLPENYRIIYMMKEVQGLSNKEVGDALELNESNIKVRLHRAKSLLKENLLRLSVSTDVFEFGNARCDAMVSFVMNNI